MYGERRTLAPKRPREAAVSLLGALLLGAVTSWLPACRDEGGVDEAVEELRDEAGDAKDELEDEIDDHS